MKRGQRGQVTVFVILGIVMLVVIIFALFVSSTLAKLKIQGEASKAVDAYLASESINYYVYTCMDSAVTSAIEDLALQGGTFFDYQDGPYKITDADVSKMYIPYNLTYSNTSGGKSIRYFNVSYSILNRSYCEIVNETIPGYPYVNTYVSNLYGLYNNPINNNDCLTNFKEGYAFSGFAGLNNMTRLCRLGSNNTKSIRNIELSPCYKSVIKEVNRSVEYLLEQQISKRMENCTNFDIFVDDNITVIGHPVTKIIYNSESLFAEITYNLSVRIKNKEPIVTKHSFNYQSDLRIVRLHNYVMSLLKADSQDFFFNMKNNYASYTTINELNPQMFFDSNFMTVKIINFTGCTPAQNNIDYCEKYKYDHLLIVEDKKSKIGNNSLTYITAIKNRLPALDYIHQTLPSSTFDIVVSDNQEIRLTPMGYDPDDTKVTYLYDGWKETFDETCTMTVNPSPSAGDPGYTFSCTKTSLSSPKPNNWTKSSLFISTKKDANYTTNKSDVGAHEVKITTVDESGLFDYQNVKILVFDLPKAVISPIRVYADVRENTTSVEDNLPLNSDQSRASVVAGVPISAYIWKIYYQGINGQIEVVNNRTDKTNLNIPQESYTLNNDTLIQIIKPLNLSKIGTHNVTLVVESSMPIYGAVVYSLPDAVSVDVKACLPHRNSAVSPFPYSAGNNPFLADHTCCRSNYELEPISTSCYSTTIYGELKSIDNTDLSKNNRFTYNIYSDTFKPLIKTGGGDANDIYKLSFDRFCDGNRGNICAGDMQKNISLHWVCANKAGGETETCSGPPANPVTSPPTSCVKYGAGNSFEREQGVAGATGICNPTKECSTLGQNGYNNGGPMRCKATCSGGTCKNTRRDNDECYCDSACGATCTTSNYYRWIGNVCQFGCNLNSNCGPQGSELLPCPGPASSNSGCYYDGSDINLNYKFTRGCYKNVGCSATGQTSTYESICDIGEVNGFCNYLPIGINPNTRCGTDGVCKVIFQNPNSAPVCNVGETRVCNTTGLTRRGWECVAAPGFQNINS